MGKFGVSLVYDKEKFKDQSNTFGAKYEAASGFRLGPSYTVGITANKYFNLTANLSLTTGILSADLQLKINNEDAITTGRSTFLKQEYIGWSTAAIVRVDANFTKRLNVFIAGTVLNSNVNPVSTTLGTINGWNTTTFSVQYGVGFTFGNTKSGRD